MKMRSSSSSVHSSCLWTTTPHLQHGWGQELDTHQVLTGYSTGAHLQNGWGQEPGTPACRSATAPPPPSCQQRLPPAMSAISFMLPPARAARSFMAGTCSAVEKGSLQSKVESERCFWRCRHSLARIPAGDHAAAQLPQVQAPPHCGLRSAPRSADCRWAGRHTA